MEKIFQGLLKCGMTFLWVTREGRADENPKESVRKNGFKVNVGEGGMAERNEFERYRNRGGM
ncbi:hypothetical protein H5410_037281, partial [Solanum commersonii]